MKSNRPVRPKSPFIFSLRSLPYGRVFGIVALVWAAVLCYLAFKNNFSHVPPAQSYSSAATTSDSLDAVKNPEDTGATTQASISKQAPTSHKQTSHSLHEPQFTEPIEFSLSEDVNQLTQIAAPTDHTPLTVQLISCNELPDGYQWNFIAVNHSHSPWQGKIRIFLRGPGTTVHTEEFKIEIPLEPQESIIEDYGRALHPFVTKQAPQVKGGIITEYGYSAYTEESSLLVK